jgi:hypothetical protein
MVPKIDWDDWEYEENEFDYENYYAFVDKIEELENGRKIIYFDSVLKQRIDEISEVDNLDYHVFDRSCKMIIADFGNRVFQEFLVNFGELRSIEESWIFLKLTDEPNQFRVLVYPEYPDTNNVGQIAYIETRKLVKELTQKKLKKLFSLSKYKTIDFASYKTPIWKRKLEKLDQKANGVIRKKSFCFDVTVYDVGQGNFNAITDQNGIPFLYFDVGGGAYGNAHTYQPPNPRSLCLANDQMIVLSHWDFDHWWTLNKLIRNGGIPNNLNIKILAPLQDLGPVQWRFYNLLIANGFVIEIWPQNVNNPNFIEINEFIKIIKCNGPLKNNSGLAIIVKNQSQKILLPADASYEFIPVEDKDELTGLIASHHGGKCTNNLADFPCPKSDHSKIVYSYGDGNIYHHPSGYSIFKHEEIGWRRCRATPNGSVSFLSRDPYDSPCEGELGIEQVF